MDFKAIKSTNKLALCAVFLALIYSVLVYGAQVLVAAGIYRRPLPPNIHEELNTIQWNNRLLLDQIAHAKYRLRTDSTALLNIRQQYVELQGEMKLLIQQVEDEMDAGTLKDNSLRTQLNAVKDHSERLLTAVQEKGIVKMGMSSIYDVLPKILNNLENGYEDLKQYNASEAERQLEVKKVLDGMKIPDWDDIRPSADYGM